MSTFVGRKHISRIALDRMREKVERLPGRVLDFSNPRQSAAGGEMDKVDFWYSITSATILHVNGGKVPILGSNINVAAADVTCSGTDTGALYVYLEVQVAAKTAQIVTTAVSTEPITELGVMRKVLYQLHKSSGSIVIDAIRITDPWVLPVFVE